jgi:RNA polymerase sigma-70 factor (ECF subfamily)
MEPTAQAAQFDAGKGSEAELARQITSCPAGEAQDSEAELYRRLAPRVRLYGLRHLREEQAAADLTQEVLLIVLEALRLGRVREPERLASFVLGTCRMVVLNLRRGVNRRMELLEMFGRNLPAVSPASEPELDRERLTCCVQALSERERSVVVMSFYDEQSAAEVSASLGISQANVRVIRHRALGRLRECMTDGRASK